MGKNKFKKRKEMRRRVRWAMEDLGIKGKAIAAQLKISESAVSQGCATSPRIVAALIAAGVPEKLFGKSAQAGKAASPSPQAETPAPPGA